MVFALTGCALGQAEIDVAARSPRAPPPRQTVTIIDVRDMRAFHVAPGRAEIPSLPSQSDITDGALTARTVGRMRNAYNMKIGEVVLPPNQTVAGLVREAVTTALRENGYAVVDAPEPGVTPVSIDIQQFWAWSEPAMLTVRLEFASYILVYGRDIVDRAPLFVQGRASVTDAAATVGTWQQLVQQGLDNLVSNLKKQFEPAALSPGVAISPGPE